MYKAGWICASQLCTAQGYSIYVFAITFKAICIKKKKKERKCRSGEFEMVEIRYRDLIGEAVP